MNKNIPLIFFTFYLSLVLGMSMHSWFSLWMVLELNVLSFIGGMFFFFSSKMSSLMISYFLVQAISSLLLFLSISSKLFFKPLPMMTLIFVLSLLLKLGMAPLHSWIILIASYASWITLYILCTLQKLLPVILLDMSLTEICFTLMIFIIWSIISGSMLNFTSTSLKTLLVCSSVSSVGWLLLGMVLSESVWKMYFLFYLVLLGFLILEKKKNSFFYLMALTGLPPFLSFFPKMMMLIFLEKFNNMTLISMMIFFTVMDIFIFTKFSFFFLMKKTQTKWKSYFSQNTMLFLMMNLILFISVLF